MPKLVISSEGLSDFGDLPKPQRAKVRDVFAKFQAHQHAGLHLEKLENPKDPRVRTIRIDQQYRGIVMAPDQGDTFTLVRVLTHDKADNWVSRNTFRVNEATGALEVQDLVAIQELGAEVVGESTTPATLFVGRSDKDFQQLGIPAELIPLIRTISDDAQLDALATLLTPGQEIALTGLATGATVEEIWAELVADEDPGAVDTDDLDAALERPVTRAGFFVTADLEELQEVLDQPFAAWRVFLHPDQRRLAYRREYNGPVRVTGGAGTGKTTVALHRARALAELGSPDEHRILFTTFTRSLTAAIEEQLRLLGGPALANRVDVINVDRLAAQIVREAEGRAPRLATDDEVRELWRDVVDENGTPFTPTFLDQEWRHVVLGQGLADRDTYLTAARPGRGVRLTRRQRIQVWRCVEDFTNRLVGSSRRTHLQLADAAASALQARSVKPYDHVLVDEAQDLHPAQWRMLRAAVAVDTKNDMFIVGDTHQRIYDNRVTLSRVGINVRGRSRRLRINYRTTHEILRWSLGLLRGEAFDDMDDSTDTLEGYRSQMHGAAPTVEGYPSTAQELAAMAGAVQAWLDAGVAPGEIGIAARTRDRCTVAVQALEGAGIAAVVRERDKEIPPDRIAVATMHQMKGHEFRCVAIVDASEGQVPSPYALTPEAVDPTEHANDLKQERSLLYVACTRARDDLRISWSGAPSEFLAPLL